MAEFTLLINLNSFWFLIKYVGTFLLNKSYYQTVYRQKRKKTCLKFSLACSFVTKLSKNWLLFSR